jgi:hypothetical protein
MPALHLERIKAGSCGSGDYKWGAPTGLLEGLDDLLEVVWIGHIGLGQDHELLALGKVRVIGSQLTSDGLIAPERVESLFLSAVDLALIVLGCAHEVEQ